MATTDGDHLPCVVCQESLWDTGEDGDHLPCSLRCGHLFGRPCIERWIRRLGKTKATCPLCSAPCALKDVWNVLVREPLRTVDAEQIESAEQACERARSKRQALQRDVGRAHMALVRARLELRRLGDSADSSSIVASYHAHAAGGARAQLAPPQPLPRPTAGSGASDASGPVSRRVASVAISGGRFVAFGSAGSQSVFVSQQGAQANACGYARLSLHDTRHRTVVSPHTKPVRGLVVCPHDLDGAHVRVLTCALDGVAHVSSSESQNVLVTLAVGSPAWACAWDPTAEQRVYVAAAARSELLVFDLRWPAAPLAARAAGAPGGERAPGAPGPPFHSLVALAAASEPRGAAAAGEGADAAAALPSGAGLLCASQATSVFWPLDSAGALAPPAEQRPLAVEARCQAISLSFRAELGVGLVSHRKGSAGADAEHGATHALFARDGRALGALSGYTCKLALARSALLALGGVAAFVASGDEATRRTVLWRVGCGTVAQELEAHDSPVLDVAQLGRTNVFATASASRLDLHALGSGR